MPDEGAELHRHRTPHGNHVLVDLDDYSVDLRIITHHRRPHPRPPHPHHELALGFRDGYTDVSGRDLHVNLHDNATGSLRATEVDAAGVEVTGADAVPVTFAIDDDTVLTLTDNGDGTATVENVTPPAVGSTAVVTASATLPDGTTAQGSVAIDVVSGPVASITVEATENPA